MLHSVVEATARRWRGTGGVYYLPSLRSRRRRSQSTAAGAPAKAVAVAPARYHASPAAEVVGDGPAEAGAAVVGSSAPVMARWPPAGRAGSAGQGQGQAVPIRVGGGRLSRPSRRHGVSLRQSAEGATRSSLKRDVLVGWMAGSSAIRSYRDQGPRLRQEVRRSHARVFASRPRARPMVLVAGTTKISFTLPGKSSS